MLKPLPIFIAMALGLIGTAHGQDEDTLLVPIKRMTLETALGIAQGAVEACRKEGIQISATVLDRSGDTQVQIRDVLAPRLTLSVSRNKAYTALQFNTPTSGLAARANSPLGWRDDIAMHAGGIPIQAAGELVGAIGVSGAPAGETDEMCAQAGIEVLQADLDMAD